MTVKQGRAPEPADVESLPSFADEESDNRTTSVKPRIRFDKKALQQPPKHDTVHDLPIIDMDTEEDDEEDPTSPARLRPRLPEGLAKLPPPPRTLTSGSEPPPAPSPPGPFRPHGPGETSRLPRTEGELMAEVERLAQQAARLRAEADRSAKLAAHRAVLAQLGAEAAQIAAEAGRALATQGQAQALSLMSEALRLEDSVTRGEEQARALGQLPDAAPRSGQPERSSSPPPAIENTTLPLQMQSPVSAHRITPGPASNGAHELGPSNRAPSSMPLPAPGPMTDRVPAPATEPAASSRPRPACSR